MPAAKTAAVVSAHTNIVTTHEANCCPKSFQLTPLRAPSQRPTPMIAPMMHCDDDVGRPICVVIIMVSEVASSAQKPRVGESLASATPIERITW